VKPEHKPENERQRYRRREKRHCAPLQVTLLKISQIFFFRICKISDSLGLRWPGIGLICQNLGSKGARGKIFKNKQLAALEERLSLAAVRLSEIRWGESARTCQCARFNFMSKGRSSRSRRLGLWKKQNGGQIVDLVCLPRIENYRFRVRRSWA
jgi:hypothetical protein